MSAADREQGRWAAAAAVAVAGVLISLALFRLPPRPVRAPSGPKPMLGLASLDTVLREQTELNDTLPLFLPTEWNASPRVAQPDPAATFGDYPARYAFPPSDLPSPLAWPPFAMPGGPAEALAGDHPGNSFGGIGRRDVPAPAVAPRGAFIEVTAAGTGRIVLARAVAARAPGDTTLYQLEFSASVDSAGLVGPLKREDSLADSKWPVADAISAYFQNYLAQVFWLGNRLPPGSYRIRVGP